MKTRYDRAVALADRLKRGPSLSTVGREMMTKEDAERQVRGWLESWIIEDVNFLVPELRETKRRGRPPG